MLAEMFSGGTDFRAMRQKMRDQQAKMRDQIMAALATSLGDEQIEALKAHLQQQQQGPRSRGSQRGGAERRWRSGRRWVLEPNRKAVQQRGAGPCFTAS